MKKITVWILILSMLCTLLASCGGSTGEDQQSTTSDDIGRETPDTQKPDALLKDLTLTVAGKDIKDFTIVYAESEFSKDGSKTFDTEWDFYRLTAERIRARIYEYTGVVLNISKDTRTDESANEILVGPTNRAESDVYDGLDVYTYENFVKNGKLVIGAGYNSSYVTADRKTNYCWSATYHAFDYITDYLCEKVTEGNTSIDLAADFSQKGEVEGLLTVACIGDSITEGAQASDREKTSWPSVLQRLLWQDYVIANLGYSTKAMRSDLSSKYKDTVCYNALGKYGEKFDIALIMLGTNDSYADPNFTAAEDEIFKSSALDIVKQMTGKNKDLKITIMNCPAYYGTGTSGSYHVRNLQANLVSELKKKGYDTSFFDMHTFTDENLGPSRYPDGLHPGDEGYSIIAHRLADVVPAMLEGRWNMYKQEIIPAA